MDSFSRSDATPKNIGLLTPELFESMKIVICGSMSASKKMVEVGDELTKRGHEIELPKHVEKYASEERSAESQEESAENKIADDLIRDYYNKIAKADAILVVNEAKNGIDNYIGGNVFLEMGFAHVLGKKIYLLNGVPEVSYKSEIVAMQPVVFNGELENINEVG